MSTPLITWGCIVGLLIVVLLVRLFRAASFCSKNQGKILSFMTEREEFFVPGDPNPRKVDENDFDDFDDL